VRGPTRVTETLIERLARSDAEAPLTLAARTNRGDAVLALAGPADERPDRAPAG